MSTIVLKRLERMKLTMDNGAMVYIFPKNALGIDRTFGLTPFNADEGDYRTRLTDLLTKWLNDTHPLYTIYKNSNGVWVDLIRLHNAYPTADLFSIVNSHGGLFPFPVKDIPPVFYIDGEGCAYNIDQCDGNPGTPLGEIILDERDPTQVEISQFSLQDPLLAFSLRHLMQDIKVRVPDGDANKFLVWLNGVFVPIIHDPDGVTFYIRDAKPLLTTWFNDQLPGGVKTFRTNSATIEEDPDFNRIKYRIDLRIFQWNKTKIDPWVLPTALRSVNLEPSAGKFVSIVNELLFDTPIEDGHLLMEDGIVVPENEYYVDPANRRKIYLTHTVTKASLYINDLIDQGVPNPEIIARQVLSHKQYAAVNFKHEEAGKKIYLNRSINNFPGFPYAREITFDDITPHNLILVDGSFVPYTWVHRHTISLPTWFWSNPVQDREAMEKSFVERITVHEVV